MSTITRQEFISKYAENSGVAIEFLRAVGLLAIPCDCGEERCQGWQMRHWASLDDYELQFMPELYRAEIEQLCKAME